MVGHQPQQKPPFINIGASATTSKVTSGTRYGRDDLEFGELDREFLYGFHRHISGACGCSKNTIWIYMIALKHILAQAQQPRLPESGPVRRLQNPQRTGFARIFVHRRNPTADPAGFARPHATTDSGRLSVRMLHGTLLCGHPTAYATEYPVSGSADLDLHESLQNSLRGQRAPVSGCGSDSVPSSAGPGRRPDFRPAHKRMVQCLPAGRSAAGGHLAPHHVPLRPAHLRHHHHTVAGSGNRDDLQAARAQKHTHHTDLCDTHPCKAGKRYGVIVRTARKAICAMNRHPCISDCTKSKKILKQGFYRENTRYKS